MEKNDCARHQAILERGPGRPCHVDGARAAAFDLRRQLSQALRGELLDIAIVSPRNVTAVRANIEWENSPDSFQW